MRDREPSRSAKKENPALIEVDDQTVLRHLDMPLPGSFAVRVKPGRMVFAAGRAHDEPVLH